MALTNAATASPDLLAASPEVMARGSVIQASRAGQLDLLGKISQNPGVSSAAGTAINLLGVGLVGAFMVQGITMMATGKPPAFLAKNS